MRSIQEMLDEIDAEILEAKAEIAELEAIKQEKIKEESSEEIEV